MLDFVRELCQDFTGSHCAPPRWSNWSMVEPSQSSIGVDVADVATGGAGAVAPINVKAVGSYFSTGLTNDQRGICTSIGGYGAGAGIGAGWGIPFVGGKVMGRLPDGVGKKIAEKLGAAAQGKVIDMLKGASGLSVGGGTRLVYGPDAPPEGMNALEFRGFATVVSLGANFVVDGVTVGMVLFANNRPVVQWSDFLHVTAVGLIGAVGIATSLELEASGITYVVS